MMNTKEALLQIRSLLSNPVRWTRGAPARNAQGYSIGAQDPAATCYCVVGATYKVAQGKVEGTVYYAAIEKLRQTQDVALAIGLYNDSLTHDQLLAWIDLTIQQEPS